MLFYILFFIYVLQSNSVSIVFQLYINSIIDFPFQIDHYHQHDLKIQQYKSHKKKMKKYTTPQPQNTQSLTSAPQTQASQQQQKNNYLSTFLQAYMQSQSQPNYDMLAHNHLQGHSSTDPCTSQLCSTGMITSLFDIVQSQAQSLEILNKKVETIVGMNKDLINKVKLLESQNALLKASEGKRDQVEVGWKDNIQEIKVQGESVNKDSLIDILFGKQKYQYQLKLVEQLDQPLYRERNFSIIMQLVDFNQKRIQNSNKIPMSLALYTCQNPPKFIEKNTSGQKMLKGYVDQSLINGMCHFEKVQIREVTSHYRSGWIFLVAIPCMTPLGANKTQNFIQFTKIKPLVIDQVVVKAKKPKKKDEKKQESQDAV